MVSEGKQDLGKMDFSAIWWLSHPLLLKNTAMSAPLRGWDCSASRLPPQCVSVLQSWKGLGVSKSSHQMLWC
jgi:hypothetical protein